MAKIIGVKIRQNETFEREGKAPITVNKIELRCSTMDNQFNCIGQNVAKYSIEIDDLKNIFNLNELPSDMVEFSKSIIERECFFETRAKSGYNGSVTDEVVRIVFLDDLIKANTKQSASK